MSLIVPYHMPNSPVSRPSPVDACLTYCALHSDLKHVRHDTFHATADRRTYPNSCHAEAAGVGMAYRGNCTYDPSVICTSEYNPQCGRDGVTYDNPCLAAAAGAEVAHAGTCGGGGGDVCDTVYDPVCGEDGETYGNACLAEKAGAKVAREGECGPKSVFDGGRGWAGWGSVWGHRRAA